MSFIWNNEQQTLNRITDGNDVQMLLSTTCARYMNPYVPFDTGMLADNITIEPGKVTYNQIYARRQYFGDGFNFNHEKHPLATSHWDKSMMVARKDDIAQEVTEFIRRKR